MRLKMIATEGCSAGYIRIYILQKKKKQTNKQTPWSESTSELHRPSDRRLSAK
jgi:hypothetical protein